MESKRLFKLIEADCMEFMELGQEWTDSDNISSVAKSRSYAKKLMKNLKSYVTASIVDADSVKPAEVAEPVEEVEVEEVEVEEVEAKPEEKDDVEDDFFKV